MARAVRLNRQYARLLGWQSHFDRIVRLLGFTTCTPGEQEFAEAVARWQKSQNLVPDGVIGLDTWSRMRVAMAPSPCPHSLADAVAIERQAALATLRKSAHVAQSFTAFLGGLSARGRFQRTVLDNKYWFAKLYELITYYEIREMHRFEHPAFVLHFIPIFYDMYYEALQNYRNRQYGRVSSLWMQHFRVAGRPRWDSVSGFLNEVKVSIVTGVSAHINGDMARALERAYRSYATKYCLPNLPFDSFRRDFFENNRPIFDAVKGAFFIELSRMGPFPVSPEAGQFIIGTGEQVVGGGLDVDEVYRWRARAWEEARARLGR